MKARKFDKGKLRYDLIPSYPLARLAQVYSIGARKYDDDNWRGGMRFSRIYRALLSHANAWKAGETFDPEDHQHHLASVAWCAFTLLEYEVSHPKLDDRISNMRPSVALLREEKVSKLLRKGIDPKQSRVQGSTSKKRTKLAKKERNTIS